VTADDGQPLSERQLRTRLTVAPTRTLALASGHTLTFAAVSQRGYYPGQESKVRRSVGRLVRRSVRRSVGRSVRRSVGRFVGR
jgi:hypothetical protein